MCTEQVTRASLVLAAYEQCLAGTMVDHELPDAEIAAAMAAVPVLA